MARRSMGESRLAAVGLGIPVARLAEPGFGPQGRVLHQRSRRTPAARGLAAHGLALAAVTLWTGAALAAPPPDYDFDWATIGNINNRAYDREDPYGETVGRGSVPYVYRMSRVEITTAQWREFANAMAPLGETFRIGDGPDFWGAWRTGGPGGPFTLRPDTAGGRSPPLLQGARSPRALTRDCGGSGACECRVTHSRTRR